MGQVETKAAAYVASTTGDRDHPKFLVETKGDAILKRWRRSLDKRREYLMRADPELYRTRNLLKDIGITLPLFPDETKTVQSPQSILVAIRDYRDPIERGINIHPTPISST